jgi:hypothetical protein
VQILTAISGWPGAETITTPLVSGIVPNSSTKITTELSARKSAFENSRLIWVLPF